MLVHLLRSRTATRLALVTVRTLALTNPGPPSSHAANPNMHRSATVTLVPGMAMIFANFIPEFTSDVSLRLIHLTQKFYVILVLLSALSLFRSLSDPMMTWGSLLPMMCLISCLADLALKSQCVTSSASPDEIDTQFSVLL